MFGVIGISFFLCWNLHIITITNLSLRMHHMRLYIVGGILILYVILSTWKLNYWGCGLGTICLREGQVDSGTFHITQSMQKSYVEWKAHDIVLHKR